MLDAMRKLRRGLSLLRRSGVGLWTRVVPFRAYCDRYLARCLRYGVAWVGIASVTALPRIAWELRGSIAGAAGVRRIWLLCSSNQPMSLRNPIVSLNERACSLYRAWMYCVLLSVQSFSVMSRARNCSGRMAGKVCMILSQIAVGTP